jgi:hypothetical protein
VPHCFDQTSGSGSFGPLTEGRASHCAGEAALHDDLVAAHGVSVPPVVGFAKLETGTTP